MSFFDTELENVGDESPSGVLQNWGNRLLEELRQSLANKKLLDTGDLQQSLDFKIEYSGDGIWNFQLFFDDYGLFMDEGVQGVGGRKKSGGAWRNKAPRSQYSFKKGKENKPPLNFSSTTGRSLRQWSERKGLNAYAVRESIWRQGIKPRDWFTDVIETNIIEDLVENLEKAGARAVEIDITNILEGNAK